MTTLINSECRQKFAFGLGDTSVLWDNLLLTSRCGCSIWDICPFTIFFFPPSVSHVSYGNIWFTGHELFHLVSCEFKFCCRHKQCIHIKLSVSTLLHSLWTLIHLPPQQAAANICFLPWHHIWLITPKVHSRFSRTALELYICSKTGIIIIIIFS